jgi:hypothetical protein
MNRKAEALGIERVFVPKGATGDMRSGEADIRALKSKGRAKWRHEFAQHYGNSCMREVSAKLMLQSWTELSNSVVAAGWDYDEEMSNNEDSESSDEDFELRMAIDTDDEDIAMLQDEIWDEDEREDNRTHLSMIVPIQ